MKINPVTQAQQAATEMSDAQRMALALLWVSEVADQSCALQLARLARVAEAVHGDLVRARFERDCIWMQGWLSRVWPTPWAALDDLLGGCALAVMLVALVWIVGALGGWGAGKNRRVR